MSLLLKHVVPFRRRVSIVLNNNKEELNLVLRFCIDDFDYTVHVTTDSWKCFRCGEEVPEAQGSSDWRGQLWERIARGQRPVVVQICVWECQTVIFRNCMPPLLVWTGLFLLKCWGRLSPVAATMSFCCWAETLTTQRTIRNLVLPLKVYCWKQ